MNLKRLEDRAMKDEGFRAKAYLDKRANPPTWTVGYGSTQWLGRAVQPGDSILAVDAKRLLRADLYGAILGAESLFARMHEMNSVRQEVLVNMAYQMGRHRLGGFRKMIAASEELHYREMAEQMIDSMWYREQSGHRGQRLVAAMKSGEWLT